MDEKTRSRVFEPFFTTKEVGKGPGLGLSMVYGFLKQSGGDIQVESEPGRGSVFTIHLPQQGPEPPNPEERTEPTSVPDPPLSQVTVLVAEDEDALRRMIQKGLEKAGYRVLAAANGGEAVTQFAIQSEKIDLLLTDVIMPIKSGWAVSRELTHSHPGLKVLFMSGYTDEEMDIFGGVLDPSSHFIPKPFSISELIAKIQSILAGQPPGAGEK